LFTQDLNCHCFDPICTFVLESEGLGKSALGPIRLSAAYYSDYRERRRPQENMSVARTS